MWVWAHQSACSGLVVEKQGGSPLLMSHKPVFRALVISKLRFSLR
uniref:Uncharacterized protein n=1 Tax=Anguilla anguilla TaxID=7936 RepID=A0A0E9RKY9_ANGAN